MGFFDFLKRKQATETRISEDPKAMFLASVVKLVRSQPGVTSLNENASDFSVQATVNGQQQHIFLGNIFEETRELSPDERERRVGFFVASMLAPKAQDVTWEDARPRLLTVLRAPMMLPTGLGKADPQLCREFLPCLREHVVVDTPTAMEYGTQGMLKKWAVSEEELFRVGQQNLSPRAMQGLELYSETPDKIWSVESGDTYETSRLLLPGFLAGFRGKVNGTPIAIVPDRQTLLIAGDAKAATVLWMCEKAEREFAASNRSISPAVYSVDAVGKVVPYVRPIEDEAGKRVKEAHLRFAGGEYTRQKEQLAAEYEKDGIDVFVASFSGLQDPAGNLVSYCTWTQGIDALLPKTDLMAVARSENLEDGFTLVRWDDAVRIGGDALRREEVFFPTRWRTVRVLSAAQQAELASVAVKGP